MVDFWWQRAVTLCTSTQNILKFLYEVVPGKNKNRALIYSVIAIQISVDIGICLCLTFMSLHSARWLLCNASVQCTRRRHDSDDTWQTCPAALLVLFLTILVFHLYIIVRDMCAFLHPASAPAFTSSPVSTWLQANLIMALNLVSF